MLSKGMRRGTSVALPTDRLSFVKGNVSAGLGRGLIVLGIYN